MRGKKSLEFTELEGCVGGAGDLPLARLFH